MKQTCLIVADGGRARLFVVVPEEGPRRRLRLLEQAALADGEVKTRSRTGSGAVSSERNTNRKAGPVHPIAAQRERHRLEHERRFGAEIVRHAVELTADWSEGVMVVIAEPRLLGLMRERLREALPPRIRLEALAKDYSGLSKSALERILISQRLIE